MLNTHSLEPAYRPLNSLPPRTCTCIKAARSLALQCRRASEKRAYDESLSLSLSPVFLTHTLSLSLALSLSLSLSPSLSLSFSPLSLSFSLADRATLEPWSLEPIGSPVRHSQRSKEH